MAENQSDISPNLVLSHRNDSLFENYLMILENVESLGPTTLFAFPGRQLDPIRRFESEFQHGYSMLDRN